MLTKKELYLIGKKLSAMYKKLSKAKTPEEVGAIYKETYPELPEKVIKSLMAH
ncbi:hypothetical protein [Schwartzia succinivorans]|uniref:hypothetical protein n=1 Tax=Schwartzia succinivorans TaxID=55507 RepID=UPI00235251C5|nr:hypothetical protein [Schwartzia succinivorans]